MAISPQLGIRRRTIVVGLAVGVPISVVFLFRAARGQNLGRISEVLSQADPFRVALAATMVAGLYVLQAERWRRIARHEGRTSHHTCLAFVLGAVAINNIVPGRPGEALRAFWLARALRVPASRAFGTVFVDRVADVMILLGALLISVPFVPHPDWLRNILLVGLVLGFVLCAGMVASWWYASRSKVGTARAHTLPDRGWLRKQLSGLVRSIACVGQSRTLLIIVCLTAASWLCAAFAAWLVAAALRFHLGLNEAIFVTAVLNLGSIIPSSPGFVGTHQWLSLVSLGLFTVDPTHALAFSITMQALWIVPTTLAGTAVIATILLRGSYGIGLPESIDDAPESLPAPLSPIGPN
jgi:uncharacterized protein (TIRG00374 family)